jgi:LacI family transcriptional regulator
MRQTKKKRVPSEFRVGLVLQTGQAHMRGVSRGVYRFLRVNPHWRIEGEGHYPLLQWDQLSAWLGDGLIAIPNSPSQMEMLLQAEVPVVNAGTRFVDQKIQTVACDSKTIGKQAAEHLLSCGLQHFLFLSELTWENERIRHKSFAATIANAGYQCELLPVPVHEYTDADASARYHPDMDQISDGLQRIGQPVGVCTPNSVIARFVVEVANSRGFQVPDQIAVIGVNDDPLVCESTNPHISAVIQPSEQIGYEAARQLDLLMRGESINEKNVFLPPLGIAARRSTDMLAVEDEDVREALRFLREHAHEPIDVADVAFKVAISRRTLETKFQKLVGRTPALELRRVRLELAKRLLVDTRDPVTNIVFAAGFNSRQVFSTLFRRETGMTPTEYRRQFHVEVLA